MKPKVSICIPNYNYGSYIGECIRSILAQTYKEFELIIVDDASTDNSMKVINSFDDERIRVYENNHNLGITKNWNKCLKLAKGDYIAIYHSDDFYHKEIVEEEVRLLSCFKQVQLVATKATTDSKNLVDIDKYRYIIYTPFEFMEYLFTGNTLVCPSVMITRRCYEELGGYNENMIYAEDQEFYLRACLKYGLAKIESVMMYYRENNPKTFIGNFADEKKSHKQRITELKQLKALAREVCLRYKEEITDFYLNFVSIQNIQLSRRYKIIGEEEKAYYCTTRAKELCSRIKRDLPILVRDTI